MNLFGKLCHIIMAYNYKQNIFSLIIILIIFTCFPIIINCDEDNSEDETNHHSPSSSSSLSSSSSPSESDDRSSYGERLAESSYTFSSASFAREPKEETNIYSAGINAILNSDGFLNQMEKYGGSQSKYRPQGPVEMAVHSKKTIEVIPVKFEDGNDGEPQVIEISPYEVPVSIVFKTQTNKLNVNQEHKSDFKIHYEPAEEPKEINSEEEPHRVIHNVYRPVIQEVTEVVQPFRKVVQKVEPVIEEMKTIISKAAPQDGSHVQNHHQFQQQRQHQQQQFRTSGPFGFGENSKMNRFSDMAVSNSSSSNNSSIKPVLEPTEFNDKEANLHYNDIIKQYIDNLLSKQQQKAATSSTKSSSINANSIKMINIPMKSISTKSTNEIDNNSKENNNNNNINNGKKFKIIKEFRISLNDLKKQLGNKIPATNTATKMVTNPSTGVMMMRPYGSFSVSGPIVGPSNRLSTDVAGKIKMIRPSTFLQQQPSTQSARIIKTDGTIGKLNEFKRQSRSAHGVVNNINNNANPLRTYHYMNFKRFGDLAPTLSDYRPIKNYVHDNNQFDQHYYHPYRNQYYHHKHHDDQQIHRRMMNEPSSSSSSDEHINLYSQNNFRFARRYRN
ncbi:hypothetical protein DERP_006866 [Dermatophagoides pteronyssinus]|uniref:Uncharacterized protein n=1 Tax=Dermatophagoides pteronyssinus TaxID=6956 RepID=A0ABQ8IS79_DERPT|nr:hypothetical protein DERP_006866 [Dermatophagoides pteronyssinus]